MREKNFIYVIYFLIFTATCFSCRSKKDLTYLRDIKGQETLVFPKEPPTYIVQMRDNLYISVLTPNPEINVLFNPALGGASRTMTTQMFEGPASQYVNGFLVDLEGFVNLPLLGKVYVQGKTVAECEKEIQSKADSQLKEATVKVRLLNFRITIMGEVKAPGVYYNYNEVFTIMDAISMANGITDYAELSKILVLRPIEGGSQTYTVNLNSSSALSSEAYYLQPNDVVMIEPSRNKNLPLQVPLYTIILSSVSAFLLLVNFLVNN